MLTERRLLLRRALSLAWFTVGWNILEGVVAIAAAVAAGSRALLGFGLDSGVESLSATVVLWRLYAERRDPHRAEAVERRALRLIGVTFFVLAAFVAVESLRALLGRHQPDVSVVGIVLTALSVVVMQWLARTKRRVGIAMESNAVQADSSQTSACVYHDRRALRPAAQRRPRVVVGRPARRARSRRVLAPRGPRSAHRRTRPRLLLTELLPSTGEFVVPSGASDAPRPVTRGLLPR